MRKYGWLIFLALFGVNSLSAAEITGKVRDTSQDSTTVLIEGDTLPIVGDSVEIFFKLPGANEEISVASGKVMAVDAKVVKVKIETTTGTVEKDQLARIRSGGAPPASGASPAATSSPSGPAATTEPSIVGHWVGNYRDGTIYSYTFNADQTFTWTIEEKKASSDAGSQTTVHGKYRLNNTTKPNRMEMFDFDHPAVPIGQTHSAPFEFQGDSKFKMDLSQGAQEHPENGFTHSATIFSKVTGSSITGDWVTNAPEGFTVSLSFKEDGSLLWVTEDAQFAESTGGKYHVDPSTQPQGIELSDLQEGEVKGIRLRGIFELQRDGRLKLDFAKDEEAPPKEFGKSALVFSRATSPIVRPNKPPRPKPTPGPASTPYVAPTPAPDEALIDEALERHKSGDDSGAIELLSKAIALNPKNGRAFYWRGSFAHNKQDYAAAVADYEKAQELDPTRNLQDLIQKVKAVLELTSRASPEPTRAKKRSKKH
jgi:uncharacterized protein (TIGR03067 family)